MPFFERMPSKLERKDAEQSWGHYDQEISTAMEFWHWWDIDSDSDMQLSGSPSDVLEGTLLRTLPAGESAAEKAKVIARAARLLSMDRWDAMYLKIFNSLQYEAETGVKLLDTPKVERCSDLDVVHGFLELVNAEERQGE